MTIMLFYRIVILYRSIEYKVNLSDYVPGNMVQVFAGMQMVSIGFHHHGNLVDKVHI